MNLSSLRVQPAAIGYLRAHRRQIARFALVGLSTFVLYIVLFRVLYGAMGFGYKIAISVAYFLTVCCHFILNRMFTFNVERRALGLHVGRYGLMLLLNYLITLAVVWAVVELLGMSPYLGAIASTAVSAMSSFLAMKHFVFRHPEGNR